MLRAMSSAALLLADAVPAYAQPAGTGSDKPIVNAEAETGEKAARQRTLTGARSPSHAEISEPLNRNTVSIISGTPAGTYLSVAHDRSAVLDDAENLRVLAIAGNGSVQNVRDIQHRRGVNMGIVQSDVMGYFKQKAQ